MVGGLFGLGSLLSQANLKYSISFSRVQLVFVVFVDNLTCFRLVFFALFCFWKMEIRERGVTLGGAWCLLVKKINKKIKN